jgi:hypothetical protein
VTGVRERVIVVCVKKAGTHLIQELMIALGYRIYGQSRIPQSAGTVLSAEEQRRYIELIDGPEEYQRLSGSAAATRAKDAWDSIGWAWQLRLGLPLKTHYGTELIESDRVQDALRKTSGMEFSETPAGLCWVFHDLDVQLVDGKFLAEWETTGEPAIIFLYRDPRDTVLSMVNFLSGKTRQGYGTFSDFTVFNTILTAKPDLPAQLRYALADDSFPGISDHQRMRWLLHHPRVCKVAFEDLIGERGGGSRDRQEACIQRVLRHVGADADPAALAKEIYNEGSFTFFKGRSGTWRDAFDEQSLALAERRFGSVLDDYGYRAEPS